MSIRALHRRRLGAAVLIAIAGLAFLIAPAYAVLGWAYWRKRWIPYLAIVAAEIAAVILAAGGWVTGGH